MKPCKKCGASDRFPSGGCRPCDKAYRDVYRKQPGYAAKNLEYQLRWQKKHPEKARARSRVNANRRRARKVAAAGMHNMAQVKQRWEMYGGLCWICRKAKATATDHVLSLCSGGSNWAANLRPACQPCNGAKVTLDKRGASAAEIVEWAMSRRLVVA